MSGPIVRKYGFPNFEKIFGPKPALHGDDLEPKAPEAAEPPREPRRDEPDRAEPSARERPSPECQARARRPSRVPNASPRVARCRS